VVTQWSPVAYHDEQIGDIDDAVLVDAGRVHPVIPLSPNNISDLSDNNLVQVDGGGGVHC